MVASFIFDRERIKSPDPHLPQAFLQSHANSTVKGMYRICVASDGSVSKVETVTSLSGADQTIIEQVGSTWQYKPQPVPVCTIRVFEFHIN
jgi:protein TonB